MPATRPTGARRPGRRLRESSREYWPVICVLALIVASDYEFRRRGVDETVGGHPDAFVLAEIGVYALVACFLFVKFRPLPRARRAGWPAVLGYAYVVVLAGSALYSPYGELALVRGAQLVVLLALSRSIARHGSPDAPHRIAHGYVVLIAASVAFGVLVPFPRLPSQPGRFTWLDVHPVQAGTLLAIAVVILTGYLLAKPLPRAGPAWPLGVYLLLLAICVAALVATNTRGAAFGAAVGIVVLVSRRWRGVRRVEALTLSGAIVLAAGIAASTYIRDFLLRGESLHRIATLNSRTELWGQALADVAHHPLYGFGLSAARGLFLESMGLGGGHNAVINLLVDTGALGLAVWLALLGAIVAAALRMPRADNRTDGTLVLALLLAMLADAMFTQGLGAPANVMCTWLFVLIAWVESLRATAHDPDPSRQHATGNPPTPPPIGAQS